MKALALLRFEMLRLISRPLARIALAAPTVAALLRLAFPPDGEESNAYALAGAAGEASVLTTLFLCGLLGATAYGGAEGPEGLRALRLRAISGPGLVLTTALLLSLHALLATGCALLVGGLGAELIAGSFGDVTRHGLLQLSAAEMAVFFPSLPLAALPALVLAPLFGLLLATRIDDGAFAFALLLPVLAVPALAGRLAFEPGPWWPGVWALSPFEELQKLAEGQTLRADALEREPIVWVSLRTSAAWSTGLIGLAMLLHTTRETRT